MLGASRRGKPDAPSFTAADRRAIIAGGGLKGVAKRIVVKADALYDGTSRIEGAFVALEGDRVVEVGKADKSMRADFSGFVTPAFIDAHSHIGMFREGEPQGEAEGNDTVAQMLPLSDPVNSAYWDDRAFEDAVDFGVLYSCLVPGSGNLIGGRARVIRTFTPTRKDAVISDYGYKMALGYNPRSTTAWKGDRPSTRMGVYQMLERRFDEVIAKTEKSVIERERKFRELDRDVRDGKKTQAEAAVERHAAEADSRLALSSEELAIADMLSGRPTIKVHVHKEDDALYLIQLAKRYGLKVTADHLSDVNHREIFDELAKAGIPIVYGPLGSLSYKVELKHDRWQNAGLLLKSKAYFGLMTDHPVVMTYNLRDTLKFFMVHGMSDADAIGLITRRNAEILGLKDLGTLEEGKLASLLVWDRDPLHLGAMPRVVIAEGRVLRKP